MWPVVCLHSWTLCAVALWTWFSPYKLHIALSGSVTCSLILLSGSAQVWPDWCLWLLLTVTSLAETRIQGKLVEALLESIPCPAWICHSDGELVFANQLAQSLGAQVFEHQTTARVETEAFESVLFSLNGRNQEFLLIRFAYFERRACIAIDWSRCSRMKTASDTEEVASWTYDLDSRQLLWSEGCYRFFGLGATRCGDEMETWKSLIDSRDRNRWDSAFHEFLQGNKPIMELGVRLVKPRSDVVIVRAIASKKKNQLMGLYELASEDMLSKDATELDEDSKSADRMKTEFLTVMSHEIRTPMNGIMGFTNLLSSTTLTKDQRLYVDTIESSGNALMTILNDVLDFSKIEAGKMLIEPIPIELKSLVTDVFVLHEPSATCKDVDMTLDLQESLPNLLICDAVRVRQILGNLVGNAIKFTDNGFIRISVFGKKQHESWSISLKITDSGIGMTEECKRRLFKPFTQGDSSESRRFGGTGLGLAISYHLCRLMGGNIHVQSRLGEGSTFTATFIASEAENNCVLPEETSCLSPRKLRVLVADDNKINRDLIGRLLNKLGHHATMAEDGENVLQIWKTNQNKFDIIMTDLQMPGKTGFEAASAIRSFEREQDNASSIPIIAVTADATGGTKAMCFECGMNDLLTKPLSLQDLKRVLKKWSSDS